MLKQLHVRSTFRIFCEKLFRVIWGGYISSTWSLYFVLCSRFIRLYVLSLGHLLRDAINQPPLQIHRLTYSILYKSLNMPDHSSSHVHNLNMIDLLVVMTFLYFDPKIKLYWILGYHFCLSVFQILSKGLKHMHICTYSVCLFAYNKITTKWIKWTMVHITYEKLFLPPHGR